MEANDRLSHLGKSFMAACIACTNAQDGCLQAYVLLPKRVPFHVSHMSSLLWKHETLQMCIMHGVMLQL